jgi:nucleoside-diphosphate-sugar epimerase/membrane protease YdiL (CAAX protease family)
VKVAVAGGSGFVGRHVVERLQSVGHDVIVLARGRRGTTEGTALVACDVARDPLPTEVLRGCDAMVNLVGIKRECASQTFEAVHVGATQRLVAACRESGIRRLIHLSVVGSRPDQDSAYHETKWRAEEVVRGSGLDFTILRPGIIYGPGDDMVSQLVRIVRFAPLVPVLGQRDSLLQPVDVRDVAEAAAAALDRPRSIGGCYDVVGPERHTLMAIIGMVAEGTGLAVRAVPVPIALQRLAVRAMDALLPDPPSTPSQLQMLVDGLCGDTKPARRDLGLAPRPFTAEAVAAVEPPIGPLFGVSLRLAPRRSDALWIARRGSAVGRAVSVALAALAVHAGLALVVTNVWYRMAVAALVLSGVAIAAVPVGWRDLIRPHRRHLVEGVIGAMALYVLGAAMARLLSSSPVLAAEIAVVYAWRTRVPEAFAIPLLILIVAGEEIVWRAAITLPLAARLGPWTGALAGAALFALAHAPLGVPVLLVAALGAGAFWGAVMIKTRSLVPAFVSHVLWDLAVLFWIPYASR